MSAIFLRDLCELRAHPNRLVERHAAGEPTRANALTEGGPFGKPHTLKSDRLRQPVLHG